MDLNIDSIALTSLGAINVIIGKNGVGKSELLRALDKALEGKNTEWLVKYISPERGGELAFNPSVEQNLRSGNWGLTTRRRNRVDLFRNMTFSEYKTLEILVLRKKETDPNAPSFDATLSQINTLLDNVKVVRGSKADPEIRRKIDNKSQTAETMSSGESELLSLAIEILSYCYQADHPENATKKRLLLLDEPDVHLHPDLQHRFMKLIIAATEGKNITTIIATHSTAVLGALSAETHRVAFMKGGFSGPLKFQAITQQLRDVIPVFGAHPLTNIFNSNPILLVEGEDDVRIWQQAVRSSNGRIALWPCEAGDVQSLGRYEGTVSDIIAAVYDDAKAYSLRDRDDNPYEISDKPNIICMRLFCRAAENLILSDEALCLVGQNWETFQERIREWLIRNPSHPQSKALLAFSKQFDRVNADVKDLRTLFLAIAGSNKPWEQAVGQAIARLNVNSPDAVGSLAAMLGPKVVKHLRLRTQVT